MAVEGAVLPILPGHPLAMNTTALMAPDISPRGEASGSEQVWTQADPVQRKEPGAEAWTFPFKL